MANMIKRRIIAILLVVSAFCMSILGCDDGKPVAKTEFLLGTTCSITVYQPGKGKDVEAVFDRIREIENLLSVNLSGSDVDQINRNAGVRPVEVGDETFYLLRRSLEICEETGAAFEPTIGPLVKEWGIGTESAAVPGADKIAELLRLVNYRDVVLDDEMKTVFLRGKGMRIDLGAIAKGYAADEAAEKLRDLGFSRGIIDFGGNIDVFGEKKSKEPWKIGIQRPHENRGSYFGIVTIGGGAVVSSGTYERYFIENGKRYHHILQPDSGYPVENGLESVTIIAESATTADAYSTAVFVLGLEEGRRFINGKPGVEAIFVTKENEVYITAGLTGSFMITDAEYTLIE